jgi:hypothetical protein
MYTHGEQAVGRSEARDKSSLNAIHQFRRRWNQRTFQWKEAKVRFVQNPYRLSNWATTKHHTFSSLVRMAHKQLFMDIPWGMLEKTYPVHAEIGGHSVGS